jgi:tRNA threonylcarbamoyladenosine biosynthesis protein TsaB
MEVFTAVYKYDLKEVLEPCSMILDNDSFKNLIESNIMYFSGSGSTKFQKILAHQNAKFLNKKVSPDAMATLSNEKFNKNDFQDIAYTAPVYLKEFYTP